VWWALVRVGDIDLARVREVKNAGDIGISVQNQEAVETESRRNRMRYKIFRAQGCAYRNEVNGPRFAQAILTHQRTAGCTAVVIEITVRIFCKKAKV
jgi:hypothetical protein